MYNIYKCDSVSELENNLNSTEKGETVVSVFAKGRNYFVVTEIGEPVEGKTGTDDKIWYCASCGESVDKGEHICDEDYKKAIK